MKLGTITLTGLVVLASTICLAVPDPKSVMNNYFEDLANENLDHLGTLLADTIVWHQPGSGALSKTYNGKNEVFALFGKFMSISQNTFKIDRVNNVVANGNMATATLHFSASKADGARKISMDGVDVMKIEGGQIQEVWLFSADQAAEDQFWSN